MSSEKSELVKVYDFETRETTMVPATELAAGMIRVRIKNSDEIIWVDSAKLKESGFRHPPFTGAFREKILFIEKSLSDVYSHDYEYWEDGFRRDLHAEQEINRWVHISTCFNEFVESHSLSIAERKEAFQVLCACLSGTRSTIFDLVSINILDRSVAEKLADMFFSKS